MNGLNGGGGDRGFNNNRKYTGDPSDSENDGNDNYYDPSEWMGNLEGLDSPSRPSSPLPGIVEFLDRAHNGRGLFENPIGEPPREPLRSIQDNEANRALAAPNGVHSAFRPQPPNRTLQRNVAVHAFLNQHTPNGAAQRERHLHASTGQQPRYAALQRNYPLHHLAAQQALNAASNYQAHHLTAHHLPNGASQMNYPLHHLTGQQPPNGAFQRNYPAHHLTGQQPPNGAFQRNYSVHPLTGQHPPSGGSQMNYPVYHFTGQQPTNGAFQMNYQNHHLTGQHPPNGASERNNEAQPSQGQLRPNGLRRNVTVQSLLAHLQTTGADQPTDSVRPTTDQHQPNEAFQRNVVEPPPPLPEENHSDRTVVDYRALDQQLRDIDYGNIAPPAADRSAALVHEEALYREDMAELMGTPPTNNALPPPPLTPQRNLLLQQFLHQQRLCAQRLAAGERRSRGTSAAPPQQPTIVPYGTMMFNQAARDLKKSLDTVKVCGSAPQDNKKKNVNATGCSEQAMQMSCPLFFDMPELSDSDSDSDWE